MTRPATDRPTIVWFRLDLRLADNPALAAAAARGAVIPVYVLDDGAQDGAGDGAGDGPLGGAGRWWLHRSLAALDADLRARGAKLVLLRGAAETLVPALAAETGAAAVYWNRRYEPAAIARDTAIKAALQRAGVEAGSFNSALLHEPWTVKTGGGSWYKIFTPFWKACLARPAPPQPVAAPDRLVPAAKIPPGDSLADWGLLPRAPDWAAGLRDSWTPGEAGAAAGLRRFLEKALPAYVHGRDRPGEAATSRLSPHLRWGEIGPRQVWHALEGHVHARGDAAAAQKYRAELGWREFAHHLLFHVPDLPARNFRDSFDAFPWRDDAAGFRAWTRGHTGYPIVDAGMRELWHSGWMHNRVRMVAASFLVKHLLVDWRRGMDWFADTLVDADLANNAAGWQWVAGSGADAAPYFRVFNPVLQGEKFDPEGAYVRRWLPELARLPDKWIHRPWAAPDTVLREAAVRLGESYPKPVVDHRAARARALAAYEVTRAGRAERDDDGR